MKVKGNGVKSRQSTIGLAAKPRRIACRSIHGAGASLFQRVPQSPDEAFPLRVIRQPPAKPFHRLRRRGVLQAGNALEEAMGVSIVDS